MNRLPSPAERAQMRAMSDQWAPLGDRLSTVQPLELALSLQALVDRLRAALDDFDADEARRISLDLTAIIELAQERGHGG